jgi:hypothetical protein
MFSSAGRIVRLFLVLGHGLINKQSQKHLSAFLIKLTDRKSFPSLFAILADMGWGERAWHKTCARHQKVSDGKRSLSIIHVHCRLCILLVNALGAVGRDVAGGPGDDKINKDKTINKKMKELQKIRSHGQKSIK